MTYSSKTPPLVHWDMGIEPHSLIQGVNGGGKTVAATVVSQVNARGDHIAGEADF